MSSDDKPPVEGAKSDISTRDKSSNGTGPISGDQSTSSGNDSETQSAVAMMQQMIDSNPSLRAELLKSSKLKGKGKDSKDDVQIAELLNSLSTKDGKKIKDMTAHKFWQTQPVLSFDEAGKKEVTQGPIKTINPAEVPQEPSRMLDGFEWVTVDMTEEKQAVEVYELLNGHYVEDADAQFRFNYSVSFFNWALKSPGWLKEWHVGVRATKSKKLVAFISGVPMQLRVRGDVLKSSEINFLCVHKKLRAKRLAPVLIQEITRRCFLQQTFQAIYTAGIVIPTPVSSCRYYHRSLDWAKLHDVGFCAMPPNSTKGRQLSRYQLPDKTATAGLRPMRLEDVAAVRSLLERYLKEFDMAPVFTNEEIQHWMLDETIKPNSTTSGHSAQQVVWAYVVEDPSTHKITDFFSFYCLESSVINHKRHANVRAAYLFYYATEAKFVQSTTDAPLSKAQHANSLASRLNLLINDALIVAKNAKFDVFNALTLLDNPLFLEQLKFGAGDGQLHYYLYNYRTAPIASGVNANNKVDATESGGIGVVML